MQSVDIRTLDLDIVHAGMDQRKIHMLVREIFPRLSWKVPVSVHHHLLPGLEKPLRLGPIDSDENFRISSKMSKSKPNSSISIHDDEQLIRNKIAQAYVRRGFYFTTQFWKLFVTSSFTNLENFKSKDLANMEVISVTTIMSS